jgi:putative FmdB family regulatory protein
MPIYEYRCGACGFQSEYLRKVTDPPLSVCPECGKEAFTKLPTAAGFQLKGSGWYATDFKQGPKPAAAKKDKDGKRESGAKQEGESTADAASTTPAPTTGGAGGSTTG